MNSVVALLLLLGLTLGLFYVLFRLVIGPLPISPHREMWVVTCPEAHEPALVSVTEAGPLRLLLGRPHFRVTECTSCPQGNACGRNCVRRLGLTQPPPPNEPLPSLTHLRIPKDQCGT
jgi:hypothetical protein